MLFEGGANVVELLVNLRHIFLQLGDLFGRADAGDHILALGVNEIFAVKDLLARGRIAREGHARAAIVAHVAEHHRADVGSRPPIVRNAILPAIDDRPLVHPRAEHGPDGAPHLLVHVVREVFAGSVFDCFLEALNQLFQVVRGQVGVELRLLGVLELVHDLLERIDLSLGLRFQSQHHVAVHLDEAAVAIPTEALVAGFVNETLEGGFIQAKVEDRVHHARHADARAGPARNQERIFRIAELGAHRLFGLAQSLVDLRF